MFRKKHSLFHLNVGICRIRFMPIHGLNRFGMIFIGSQEVSFIFHGFAVGGILIDMDEYGVI